jgi:broad specificity phosphatase PhoE
MTTILLARHGETDWNLERRVQGHSDRPLNESGRAQALALADRLSTESLDAVYSSDLARARETAAVIAARHGLDVIETSDLREKDFGSWEGMTDTEIFARFPNAHRGEWGDGESRDELADRVVAALKEIAAAHLGGRVLVVTHGGPMRAALTQAGGELPPLIANCDVVHVTVADGQLATGLGRADGLAS